MSGKSKSKKPSFLRELVGHIFGDVSYILQMSAVFGLMVFGAGVFLLDLAVVGIAIGLLIVGFIAFSVMNNL